MMALAGCSGESYQPELKSAEVSRPTIGQEGTLRVGVNADKAPLAGASESGGIVGIDVDVAARIADELGLSVTIVDVGSDPEDALANDEVDIVMGIDQSSSLEGIWLSDAYLPTGVSLFTLSSGDAAAPTAVSDGSVGAQVSSTSSWAVTNEFGDAALKQYSKLSDAFTALEAGDIDYVAADAVIGAYAAHRQDIDVTVVGLMSSLGGYCIGVSETNVDLQSVIADVLDSLVSGGVVDVVEMKWMGAALDLSGVSRIEGTLANATTTEGEGVDGDANADEGANADADEAGSGTGAGTSADSSAGLGAASSVASSASTAAAAV